MVGHTQIHDLIAHVRLLKSEAAFTIAVAQKLSRLWARNSGRANNP